VNKLLINIFLKNWGLKLFSLLVALLLWLVLIPEEKMFSEKTLTVPLEIHNIPSDMELVKKPPATVDVKIRAPNRLINDISATNVHAVLNLQNARLEQEEYPLHKNMISIPQGAEVKDIYPSQVNLKLERTKEVLLDVIPTLSGNPREGFMLSKIEVIPSQILVKGPESKVKENYKVRTSPIDISSLTQPIELEADLIPPTPDLKFVSLTTKVKVKILIQEKEKEQEKPKEIRKPKK